MAHFKVLREYFCLKTLPDLNARKKVLGQAILSDNIQIWQEIGKISISAKKQKQKPSPFWWKGENLPKSTVLSCTQAVFSFFHCLGGIQRWQYHEQIHQSRNNLP